MDRNAFILEIEPSPARRVLGTGMLGGLGLMLGLLAVLRPPEQGGWQLFLIAGAAASLWLARGLWRASMRGLVLDAAGLREAGPDGRWIAPIEALEGVERGPFAFKPSNGFLLRTRSPGPRAWAPGVWWRLGRRVGVGGVLNAAQARAAAEVMEAAILSSSPSRSADRSGDG